MNTTEKKDPEKKEPNTRHSWIKFVPIGLLIASLTGCFLSYKMFQWSKSMSRPVVELSHSIAGKGKYGMPESASIHLEWFRTKPRITSWQVFYGGKQVAVTGPPKSGEIQLNKASDSKVFNFVQFAPLFTDGENPELLIQLEGVETEVISHLKQLKVIVQYTNPGESRIPAPVVWDGSEEKIELERSGVP